MNKEKKCKRMNVNNMLALAHILDDYSDFKNRLNIYMFNNYNKMEMNNLIRISSGKFIISSRTKQFYEENKKIIDTINQYSSLNKFINTKDNIEYFYAYLNDNKDKLNDIISLLNRLKELNFNEFALNSDEDFTKSEYKISKKERLATISYLENMEVIPNCNNDIVYYKSKGSNYIININVYYFEKPENEIILNNLLFDKDKLPKSLERNEILNEIFSLKNTKKDEVSSLKSIINLDSDIHNLEDVYNSLLDTMSSLDNMENRKELLHIVLNIRDALNRLIKFNAKYTDGVVSKSNSITNEIVNNEKIKTK